MSELDPEKNDQQNGTGKKIANSVRNNTQEALKKEAKKRVEKRLKKESIKSVGKMSLAGPLATILFWVFVVIVAIIIITGIVMFLITMPGMVMEKLKAIFKEIGNYIAAFYGADTTQQIDDVQIYETLDYLEDMGWDLKAEGFLTKYYENESDIEGKLDSSDKEAGYNIDEETGVVRNDEENIILADSDFIFTYIMSDNYVYTLKNKNIATIDKADAWYEKIGSAIITGWYKVRNFFAGPLLDVLGVTDAVVDGWGKGLIVLYYDDGLGKRGSVVNEDTLWNWDSVEINTERKSLLIKRVEFLNNNNAMEFSLDGWTGRYGMPLEFLLAIHKATMMPDLAFDMATSFNTNVNVYLHDISGEVTAAYKTPSGKYVTYEDINIAKTGLAGRNWFSAFIAWFDNLIETDEETIAMKELGVDVANGENGCSCTIETVHYDSTWNYILKLEDGKYYYQEKVTTNNGETTNTTIEIGDEYTGVVNDVENVTAVCENCRKKSKCITDALNPNNDYNFLAYDLYIANVSNHWYRDVYFVLNNDTVNGEDLKFVTYDYEYEAQMKERWTLYETYTDDPADEGTYKYNPSKAGDFIVFMIDENGDYMKDESGNYVLYDGTFEEARAAVLYTKDENGNYIEYSGTYKESNGITLYEKTSEGKYVVYNGDSQVAVAKKAITIDSSDTNELEDLNWKKNSAGIWTAYEENTNPSSTSWEPLYTDEELAAIEDEIDKYVKSNSYVRVTTTGNIVQTGEGQRAETNSKIKKMFLQNQYFRYDGSDETAEIITALRKNNDIKYGALSESDLKKTVEIDGTTYTADDYSGKVLLNQDSLNAFSILENTHTLDSDYIYRDFKELVVELGYFEKEELTDETPRLLQFLVPDIGSAGYPNRTIDKRENEFGTMIHSKSDIDANQKYTLSALQQKISEMEEIDQTVGNAPDSDPDSDLVASNNPQNLSQVSGISSNANTDPDNVLSSNSQNINLKNVKGTGGASFTLERVDESGDGYVSVLKSGNVKYIHRYQGGQSYSSINFFWAGGSRTLGEAACGLFACFNVLTGYGYDFDPRKDLPGYNWPATMDAVKNLMEEKGVPGEFISYNDTEALDSALNEGRPAILLFQSTVDKQGVKWTSGGHFVALAGKDKDGNILTLDSAAQGNVKRHDYPGTVEDMLPAFQTASIWIADEAPDGIRAESDPYEGYNGNEAVVSPVTGILLEYGTYDKEDEKYIDSVTNEPYRVNVDLKYGPATAAFTTDEEPGSVDDDEEEIESRIVSDEVGYAKILVLDDESYKKLESSTSNSWKNVNEGNGLLKESGNYFEKLNSEDELEDMSAIDKTVYGYKEFAETYKKYGISGYVIYIDGFKCELPDENIDPTAEDIAEQIPDGKDLTYDSFKKITESKIEDGDELIQTKYEPDEEYKTASQEINDKLNAEITVKTEASPTIYTKIDGEEFVFIKEGTVIGRTYTDKELVEERLADGEDPKYNYEYYRPEETTQDEEDEDKLIGNYIRIIMRDLDDTVIEDVETYMKLDEGTVKKECEFEQLAYFLGCLEEGFYKEKEYADSYGVEVLKDGAGNTTAFGLTKAVAELESVKSAYPSFGIHLASGSVPKEEAQDVFILVLEAAKESIQKKLTTPLDDDDSSLFALIDLHHASPAECMEVVDIYNAKNNNLTAEEMIAVFSEHWGTNTNYETGLRIRGTNRGLLASEGRFFLYQKGSVGDEVIFDTETPWTEFCEAGGTYEMITESSGLYHIEKGAYSNYSVSY